METREFGFYSIFVIEWMNRILVQEQTSKLFDELTFLMKFNPSGFMVKDLAGFITNLQKI